MFMAVDGVLMNKLKCSSQPEISSEQYVLFIIYIPIIIIKIRT